MSKSRLITVNSLVAATYIALTFLFYSLSFSGGLQFRVSELMVFLAFVDPLYIPGLVVGCFMANLLGPYGVMDALVGTIATLVSLLLMAYTAKKIKNLTLSLIISSLWPCASSLIIATGICFASGTFAAFGTFSLMIAFGEFIVVTIVGVPLFRYILSNIRIVNILKRKY